MFIRSNRIKTGAGITVLSLLLAACGKVEVKDLKPEQIAEYNKPGTVLIQVDHKLEYSYPKPIFDTNKRSQLTQAIRQKIAQGEIKSEAEAFAYAMRELLSHPLKYTSPGKKMRGQAEVPMVGTGFIVTPDGTVATAAHVVSSKGKQIKRQLARTALSQVTQGYCQQQMESLTREQRLALEGRISPKAFMNLCFDGFFEYYIQHLAINNVQTETSVVMQPANPEQGNAWKSIPSQITKVGQSAPAEDVAILKIAGNNLPTVSLGNDPVETGNEVYSLGYPGAVTKLFAKRNNKTSKEALELTRLPEPTLTAGGVSAARQSLPEGGQVIQANVAISPGNSGGALFNKKGQVVGIASFVSVNEKGEQVQGASFFVPVEVLKRQLQETGIKPQASPVTQRYQEAVDRFSQKQYKKSLQIFKDIRDTTPEFPYIQQQISKAQVASASEPFAIPSWANVLIGTATLGIGTFVGIKSVNRMRSRQAAKQAIESTLVEK